MSHDKEAAEPSSPAPAEALHERLGAAGAEGGVPLQPAADQMEARLLRQQHRAILRTVALYALFSVLWILFSDAALDSLISDRRLLTYLSVAKGWLFVAITALLLYALMRHSMRHTSRALHGRLEALSLLETIADSSDEAIFAKDLQGRYLLFNRAACRFVGKTQEEVLGRDDRAFFPPEQAAMIMAADRRVIDERRFETQEEVLKTTTGPRLFLASKGPLVTSDGRVFGIFGVSQDITERKAAEAGLRESREMLRLFIAHAPAALAMFDREMRYLAASQRWLDDYGLRGREIAGCCHYDVFPDLPAHWHAIHQRGLAGEVVKCGEEEFIRRNGQAQWLHWEVHPWHAIDGQVGGIVIFSEDISARKVAESQLRESEMRYREMFEANPLPMWVYDQQTLAFLAVNDATVAHYGYSRDEFLGMTIRDIRSPAEAARLLAMLTERTEDAARQGIWQHRRKDGGELCVEVTSHPLVFGGRRAMVVLAVDITRRLQAERQLHQLSRAVEQSPESIVITDVDANVEYVNDAFLSITGYQRDEIIGRNLRLLQSGSTPPDTYASLWQTLLRGETWKGEFFNRRSDGSEFVELAVISPIRDGSGRITNYVAVKEDITERKRMEGELQSHRQHLEELVRQRTAELEEARQAAETASIAKSAFLANMSHEIRTPMNAILGFTHLLQRSVLDAEQRDRLGKIGDAGEHLLAIINDILDLSKIEAGKLTLEQTDLHLGQILDHIHSLVSDAARQKGLAIVVDYGNVPRYLRGDPTRLRQGMLNLVTNALKFTESGTITLRSRLLADDGASSLIRFEVEDTGIGIPAEAMGELFQAFQQADASTTRKYGGTGLGLAITRRLAELMGGQAGVDSTVGRGSLFWFTARLVHGEAPQQAVLPGGDAEGELLRRHAGRRILLVEDDLVNQEVALELLAATGLVVDVAGDGREAVRKVAENDYALVLMDMQMPVMDGLAATAEIRRLPGRAGLPIVAMTANAFIEDRQRCLAAGMDDFITKPVDPEALFRSLLKWLEGG